MLNNIAAKRRRYVLTWSQAVGANSVGYYGHIVRLSARRSAVGDSQPIAALTMFGCIYDDGNRVPDHAIRKIDNVVTEHNGLMWLRPGTSSSNTASRTTLRTTWSTPVSRMTRVYRNSTTLPHSSGSTGGIVCALTSKSDERLLGAGLSQVGILEARAQDQRPSIPVGGACTASKGRTTKL